MLPPILLLCFLCACSQVADARLEAHVWAAEWKSSLEFCGELSLPAPLSLVPGLAQFLLSVSAGKPASVTLYSSSPSLQGRNWWTLNLILDECLMTSRSHSPMHVDKEVIHVYHIHHVLWYWEVIFSKAEADGGWSPRLQVMVTRRSFPPRPGRKSQGQASHSRLQKWHGDWPELGFRPALNTHQFCLTVNISLQMDKPGSSGGNGYTLNSLFIFLWSGSPLFYGTKMYFLQLFSVNAYEICNAVESS